MKLKKMLMAAVIAAVVPAGAMAENLLMTMEAPTGWTAEDGNVTVTYSFERNVTHVGGYTSKYNNNYFNANCCAPNIIVKVKNNSDDFYYLDLAKTYILRNGEAELFQNITTMSTSKNEKEEDSTKKSMAQSVMPIPPHSTKTLTFPLFASSAEKNVSGYEPFIRGFEDYRYRDGRMRYYNDQSLEKGQNMHYNQDNSPVVATISLAYTDTEGAEKPYRITKDFYVNEAVMLKSSKDKEIDKTGISLADKNWFVIWMNRF